MNRLLRRDPSDPLPLPLPPLPPLDPVSALAGDTPGPGRPVHAAMMPETSRPDAKFCSTNPRIRLFTYTSYLETAFDRGTFEHQLLSKSQKCNGVGTQELPLRPLRFHLGTLRGRRRLKVWP